MFEYVCISVLEVVFSFTITSVYTMEESLPFCKKNSFVTTCTVCSVGVHLSHEMLDYLVDYHLWRRLPGRHQTLAILMRVADFLGDTAILEMLHNSLVYQLNRCKVCNLIVL